MNEETKKICLRKVTVTEQNADEPEIEEMAEKLDELYADLEQYEEDPTTHLSKEYLRDIMEVIEHHLFRALPPSYVQKEHVNLAPAFDDLKEALRNVDDPQMKILNSVYPLLEIIVKLLKNSENLPIYISESFTERLFNLFRSEDQLERQIVSTNLEEIYTHLECRAKQINNLLCQSLIAILDNKNAVYTCVDSLLYFLLFIITNEDNPNYLPDVSTLFRILTKLHKLHYLFNFYQNLFSCCILLLEKHPLHIVSFTKNILRIFINKPFQPSISYMTTNRTLCLIELKHILQLLLRFIKEAKDESTKRKYETFFRQLVAPIVDFSVPNLKSNFKALVVMTIKMLSDVEYRKYFCKHPQIVQKILPLMRDDPHFMVWDEEAFVKQSLYRASLIMDSESDN